MPFEIYRVDVLTQIAETNMEDPLDELTELLTRIDISEDFLDRAERFYNEKHRDWSPGLAANLEKYLERKREQIYFDRQHAERMGYQIAVGHYPPRMDI